MEGGGGEQMKIIEKKTEKNNGVFQVRKGQRPTIYGELQETQRLRQGMKEDQSIVSTVCIYKDNNLH